MNTKDYLSNQNQILQYNAKMLERLKTKKEATNVSRLQKVHKKFLTRGMAAAQRGEGGL